MTFRDHGYYGYAYLGARITQAVALLPIIGLVANFLSLIAKSRHSPPTELVATIVFAAISFLWVLLSMTAYHDTHIPYLATVAVDTLFLVPFIVFAVIIGQPLSLTTCSDLPKAAKNVALPISTLPGRPVSYVVFSGVAGQTTCYELMAVWGLMIALCVLFAMSAVTAGFLLLGKRRSMGPGGGFRGGSPPGRGGKFPGPGYPNDSQLEMAPRKPPFTPSSAGGGSPPMSPMGSGRGSGSFDGSSRRSFDSRGGSIDSRRSSIVSGPPSPRR